MKNFMFKCDDGFTKTVMANTKEDAAKMFMMDEEVKNHMAGHQMTLDEAGSLAHTSEVAAATGGGTMGGATGGGTTPAM